MCIAEIDCKVLRGIVGWWLVQRMQDLQHASEDERLKLQKQYKERLKDMDGKLKELRVRERGMVKVERLKARSEEACGRLQQDILRIKQQKVALARQMEQSKKEFLEFRRGREKELLQLRRQVRPPRLLPAFVPDFSSQTPGGHHQLHI